MLNAIDYEAKHRRLQNLRHAGTGEWLFRQTEYITWGLPDKSASLGCHGIPGCGKSILASNIVDTLTGVGSTRISSASDVIYYYCDYADQRSLLFDRILGSLLKQLFLKGQIPEHVESKLLQLFSLGSQSPPDIALANILCSSVALLDDIYIIFDGLDECDKAVSRAVLKTFKQLAASRPTNVKVLVTCVVEGSIAHELNDFAYVLLSPSATSADIKAFVDSSVRLKIDSGELKIRNPRLGQDIISELVLKANGLFLWVYFQLKDLCNASSDFEIRTILKNLPMGLGETYKRILIKISQSPSGARLARKMFEWATVAKRPLHIEEFKEAVAFDQSDKSWNEDKIPHEDRMFEACRGLIIKDTEDQTVRFAHHTVPQYLTENLSTIVDPFFKISAVEAQIFAGHTCVSYLLFSDFETQLTTAPLNLGNQGVLQSGGPLKIPDILGIKAPITLPYRLLREKSGSRALRVDYSKHLNSTLTAKTKPPVAPDDKYRLLQYVIDYWETHVRSFSTSSASASAELYGPLSRLALQKTLAFDFRPWGLNQHHGPHGCAGCPNPNTNITDLDATDLPNISMLHYAAKVGNMPLLLLLQNPLVSQTRDISEYLHHERYHDETLLTACRHGRIEIVKHLMPLRPFHIGDGRAASAAATAGHADVLQHLLSFDRSWIGQQGDNLLLAAAKNGYDAVIGVLIEAGVSLGATDEQTGQGVLELVAMNGHIAAVRALLETVPWPVDSMKLALHAAARSGHSAVAEVFLEYEVNPAGRLILEAMPSSGKDAETAFHIAAQNGHVGVLELFEDYVQSVDSPRTTEELTALHVAAATGQVEVVRWLVDNGADVNAITLVGDTPLSFATSAGDVTIVRILLEYEAMALNPFISHNHSLVRAAVLEETTILELLLESMRGDPRSPPELQHRDMVDALEVARSEQRIASAGILEQELDLIQDWNPGISFLGVTKRKS